MRRLFLFICLALISKLTGIQYVRMNSTEVVSVQLSSIHHNRVGIIGDRIKKAFFKSSHISVDVEEGSGQLFIQAMRPNCPPTTLSIISASDVIQEIELNFSECPTEIVLLQPVEYDREILCFEESEYVCRQALESDALTELVNGFLKGVIPEGYTTVEDENSAPVMCDCIKLKRISRLVSENQIVFVYRMQNISSRKKCVKECQVNVLDGDWVFVDRHQLDPHECGLVLIGCTR
jgi:TraK protein